MQYDKTISLERISQYNCDYLHKLMREKYPHIRFQYTRHDNSLDIRIASDDFNQITDAMYDIGYTHSQFDEGR